MNTPAHVIFGLAAFGKPDAARVTAAALFGAILPDLSLYGMVGWHLLVLETPAEVVFDQLYFSDGWMRIFAVDNSFVLWGLALGLALWLRSSWAIALTGAALLHLALDFPFHAGDGRPQFWPLTMWIFDSPLSYWDGAYGGRIVGAVEMIACIALVAYIHRRFTEWWVRITSYVLLALQVVPMIAWYLFFRGQA